MISHPSYAVEPWVLRETALDLGMLTQSESVVALSNGHIGWRGNLEESEPHGLPGTCLDGVHELHALPYAEAGYGYPARSADGAWHFDEKVTIHRRATKPRP